MKITFKIVKGNSDYKPRDSHIVLADGVKFMSAHEGMEPEDVTFYRDLQSPFECKKLIQAIIEKVKNGEEITFEDITVEEEKE
jgi:hypothetical protein